MPVTWIEDNDSRVKIVSTAWKDIKGVLRIRWALTFHRKEFPRALSKVASREFKINLSPIRYPQPRPSPISINE